MNWAVEARLFGNGIVVAKVRRAVAGETDGFHELEEYKVLVDVFDNECEAREFVKQYRR